MSLVIAAVMKNRIYVIGDTQLNNEYGAMEQIGIKVFPFGIDAIIGITGDYQTAIKMFDEVKCLKIDSFESKVSFVKEYLIKHEANNNAVMACVCEDCGKVVVMGNDYGYEDEIEVVTDGISVKTLLPPNLTDEHCKKYINSIKNIDWQIINCIVAASEISESVNNKIFGLITDGQNMEGFTENVKYNDIDVRII